MADNAAIDKGRFDAIRRPFDPKRGSVKLDTTLATTDATCEQGEGALNIRPFLGLYVEVAGDVKFDTLDGNTDTWAVPNNFTIPLAITKVYKTGTTATGIHGMY
jgi:hypothetical protein